MPARWDQFTEEERRTIAGALTDSGGMRSDYGWYMRCSKLHVELKTWTLKPVPANPPSSGVSDTPTLTDITLDLYSACTFVKSFLTKLEDSSEPGDPLREIRRKFHAPLHAVLDAAISKARQSQPVPPNLPSSGVSNAPRWTPGPWYVVDPGGGPPQNRLGFVATGLIWEHGSQLIASGFRTQEPEASANMQLIAAAPDLYAALEEMLKFGAHEGPCDNCDPETGEQWDGAGPCEAHLKASAAREKTAHAALAKARGEKPNAE